MRTLGDPRGAESSLISGKKVGYVRSSEIRSVAPMVLDPEAVVTVVLLGLELLEERKRGDRVVCPTHPRHFHSPRSRAMAFLEPFIDSWQALAAAKQFPCRS